MCLNAMEKPCVPAKRKSLRIRDMRRGLGEEPDCQACVIGRLSVMMTILFPPHVSPHVCTAATMANSSLKLMLNSRHSSGQDDIIHEFLYVAPNPMYLQASVYKVRVVEYILLLSGMMVC